MKRLLVVAAALAAMTALAAPASAGAAPFTKYMSCDRVPVHRSHVCPRDTRTEAKVFAVFRSNAADVAWKACARFPTGRLSCSPVQQGRRGSLYTLAFTTGRLGVFKFFFIADGRRLRGAWRLRIVR
jgi:hypothetical protein